MSPHRLGLAVPGAPHGLRYPAPGTPGAPHCSRHEVTRAVGEQRGTFSVVCWRASATRCPLAPSRRLGVATEPGCGFRRYLTPEPPAQTQWAARRRRAPAGKLKKLEQLRNRCFNRFTPLPQTVNNSRNQSDDSTSITEIMHGADRHETFKINYIIGNKPVAK